MKHTARIFAFALPGLCLSTALIAQVTGARITGIVTDASNAAIPNAQITLTNTDTNVVTRITAGDHGEYSVPALPAGPYKVLTTAAGFADALQTNVVLTIGQNATLNVTLQPAGASESVTVTSGPALINATTAEISQVVTENSIKELPLNGRDPSTLVFLAAGVTNELQSQASTLPSTNSFPTQSGGSAGGGRQGSTYYLLDGVTNMDYFALLAAPFPNADATQEFRVITNNFDARYGFSPAAVVSIQSKPGTNAFHGGAFEFLRNADLNAANYFSHQVDPLKRNQFGGYLGGPVIKNKLFFFGNYQGTRQSTSATQNVTYTPTQAMLNGDFSAVAVDLAAPFATVGGKRNQIDPALFSPGALKIAASLPLGTDPATGLTNFVGPKQRSNYDEGTGRIDWTINDRQSLFARNFTYSFLQPGAAVPGNLLAGVQGLHGIYYNDAVGHTFSITPRLLNSITAFYTTFDFQSGTPLFDKVRQPGLPLRVHRRRRSHGLVLHRQRLRHRRQLTLRRRPRLHAVRRLRQRHTPPQLRSLRHRDLHHRQATHSSSEPTSCTGTPTRAPASAQTPASPSATPSPASRSLTFSSATCRASRRTPVKTAPSVAG